MSVKVSHNVVLTEVEDGTVAFHAQTGRYLHLDGMAARYIESVREGESFGRFVDGIAQEFDVPADQVREDFSRLQRELVENGYLEDTP